MKSLKNTKGITLVALIITIIVLLILAMVSISLVINDGIIGKANKTVSDYKVAEEKEQIQLGYNDYQLAIAMGQPESLSIEGANVEGNGPWTITFTNGEAHQYTLSANGRRIDGPSAGGSSTPTTNAAYAVGQEVTVGGESFYVLEASDASQSTVTLLAKYNLNKAGTAQAPNASQEDTAVAFSSTNYWASAHASYTDWSTKKLDINTVSGETSGDAIYKAKAYATSKGGTNGRLLTYEEADSLKTSYSDMIWGKANQQGEGSSEYYLYYWLSSASEDVDDGVWGVAGDFSDFGYDDCSHDDVLGVRPVITVSKSLVS